MKIKTYDDLVWRAVGIMGNKVCVCNLQSRFINSAEQGRMQYIYLLIFRRR